MKNNIKEFKDWMNRQIQSNGKKYSSGTIDSYCSSLNSCPKKLNLESEDYKISVFEYETIDSFEDAKRVLMSAPNFEEIDRGTKKSFSNALKKYSEYLADKNNIVGGKWLPDFKKEFDEDMNVEEPSGLVNKFTTLLKSTRNLILTGAPGTGKTYLAKEIAAAMGCTENEIGFVQFHPSYDYTDFVEGLRPVSKDNCDNIGFERKDGVFKEFCKKALKANFYNDSNNTDNFEESWEKMIGYLNENNFLEISLLSGKGNFRVELNEYGNGLANRTYKDDVYSEGDWIKGKSKFFSKNQLYNIYKGLSGVPAGGHDNYRKAIINHMESDFGLLKYRESKISSVSSKPFVFIIDEINRGEISKIFGELFFSIDPGYRGEKGRVKTQYQNLVEEGVLFSEGFFVPENVYIIGTMNDIDRSVESMDFAFRRRFAFAEVKAEDNVKMLDELEVLNLKDDAINRMNRLNSAISKIEGLSSAYHIGASYFLKLKEYGDDCREALWNYHLEGLLREYLRGMPNADEEMIKLENAYLGNESNTNNG